MGDIEHYYKTNKLQMPDIEAYISIKNELNNVIGELYPGAKLVMFGSTLSGLGGPDCDADLCLWFPGQSGVAGNQRVIAMNNTKLKRIYDHLKGMGPASPVVDIELSPPDSRVPIIKCIHKRHRTSVYIHVNVTDGVVATYLQVKYINCSNPLIAALVFTVKQWAKTRGICDPSNGTLKSYGWVLLVINYLQVRGVVPVYKPRGQMWERFRWAHVDIFDLESSMIEMLMDGGDDDPYSIFEHPGHHASGGIKMHGLRDFFEVYMYYAFKKRKIVVRSGKASKGRVHKWHMYIEDPILRENVAEKVDDSGLKKIRSECRRAYNIITSGRSWRDILS